MATLVKRTRRAFKRVTLGWRENLMARSPEWAKRLFVDHGIVRLVYLNRARIGDKVWRSAQPGPHQIKAFAAEGIKTIVNLRGPRVCGSYWLEQDACRHYGIALVDCQMRSRAAPSREELRRARDLFDRIEYPMLMHCKSGADRAGLMSALYCHLKLGQPIEQAIKQLSLRYGHIRQADTGILDHFFEEYLRFNSSKPTRFWDWVDTVYDPEIMTKSFQANGLASRLLSGLLRRE
jgi:protein tyrosine/serine phosphatase